MSRTVVITLGRLPKALDFARSFHAAGWRVVIAEPWRTHLTGASRAVARTCVLPPPVEGKAAYLEALCALVREEGADLILPVSEETLHVAGLSPDATGGARVFAPSQAALLELHHKGRFAALCRRIGLAAPDTAALGTADAAGIATASDYVVKPVYSCSGRGVTFHERGTPPPSFAEPAVVQARAQGEALSTFAIVHEGRVRVNVVYRATILSGSVAVAFERVERPRVDDWVSRFALAVGHTGMLSFDLFAGEGGAPVAIECNPRATSGVHFIETADIAQAILDPDGPPPRFKAKTRFQQFYPALTEVQGRMLKGFGRGGPFRQALPHLFGSREATWAANDPMPFIGMPLTASMIIWKALKTGRSFGEVSTEDISWFEGERLARDVARPLPSARGRPPQTGEERA